MDWTEVCPQTWNHSSSQLRKLQTFLTLSGWVTTATFDSTSVSRFFSSPYIPSSLLPPPHCSTRPVFFISISLISLTLVLPSLPSLFLCVVHPWASFSVSAIENSGIQLLLVGLAVKKRNKTHQFLAFHCLSESLFLVCFSFCPFTSLVFPSVSNPQHHCWSWILCCFEANVSSLPLLFPSLAVLTLFHLTWLFIHWCSDAKVMNSQQKAVCFNWCTLEILQEETWGERKKFRADLRCFIVCCAARQHWCLS